MWALYMATGCMQEKRESTDLESREAFVYYYVSFGFHAMSVYAHRVELMVHEACLSPTAPCSCLMLRDSCAKLVKARRKRGGIGYKPVPRTGLWGLSDSMHCTLIHSPDSRTNVCQGPVWWIYLQFMWPLSSVNCKTMCPIANLHYEAFEMFFVSW